MARRAAEADERLGELLAAERQGDTAHLIDALRDPDPDNRAIAASRLANLGVMEAVPGLMRLLDASDSHVRCAAVRSLGRLGAGEAADRLLEISEADEADWVRGWAISVLGELGAAGKLDERDIVPLLIALLGDPSMRVRAAAAYALGLLADSRALDPLLQARKRERGIRNWYLTREAYKGAIRAIQTDPPAGGKHAPALVRAVGGGNQVRPEEREDDSWARKGRSVGQALAVLIYVVIGGWLLFALIARSGWYFSAWAGVWLACLCAWIFWRVLVRIK